MTSRPPTQCVSCEHWVSPLDADGDGDVQTCAAFPAGIPDEIWWNRFDHRQPHEDDHGIQWESLDGAVFPEWALVVPDEDPGEPTEEQRVHAAAVLAEVDEDGPDEPPGHVAAAAADGIDEFELYWTRGKGLGRWAASLHPWTTLVRLLKKHKGIRDPKGLASHYFHVVFGFWPGHRKGDNPVGPG